MTEKELRTLKDIEEICCGCDRCDQCCGLDRNIKESDLKILAIKFIVGKNGDINCGDFMEFLNIVDEEVTLCSPKVKEGICPDCGGEIKIRNPTGHCDHLYYPEMKNSPSSPKTTGEQDG